MAELYSYTCATCGGVLNIDSDQELLDCPFCGTQLDLVAYHRKDILDQAGLCLKRLEYKSAYERYKDLYDKDPEDLEAVRGLILCAGEIPVKEDLTDPQKLIRHDLERAIAALGKLTKDGSGHPYWGKLDTVLRLSVDLRDLTKEKDKNERLTGNRIKDLGNNGDSLFDRRFKEIAASGAKNSDSINKLIKETEEKLYAACKELKKLEPAAAEPVTYSAELNKTKTGPDTGSVSDIICLKCGGQLVMDLKRSLCECRSCGAAYGTSLFFGHPDKKAKEALVKQDFSEADQRYSYMLMLDPHDFEALRGRVLCAAKWTSPKADPGISSFWVNNLRSRIEYALEKASDKDKPYFEKYLEMTDAYRNVLSYDNRLKPLRRQHKELVCKRENIVVDYDPDEEEHTRPLYARDTISGTIADIEKKISKYEFDRNRHMKTVQDICSQIKEMDTKWLAAKAGGQKDQ
ncbi:MAG: hypothetical protein J5685_07855 [Clostridiales bacterium]|nr:hypothetical protein [Clostridiales bacterium]